MPTPWQGFLLARYPDAARVDVSLPDRATDVAAFGPRRADPPGRIFGRRSVTVGVEGEPILSGG